MFDTPMPAPISARPSRGVLAPLWFALGWPARVAEARETRAPQETRINIDKEFRAQLGVVKRSPYRLELLVIEWRERRRAAHRRWRRTNPAIRDDPSMAQRNDRHEGDGRGNRLGLG